MIFYWSLLQICNNLFFYFSNLDTVKRKLSLRKDKQGASTKLGQALCANYSPDSEIPALNWPAKRCSARHSARDVRGYSSGMSVRIKLLYRSDVALWVIVFLENTAKIFNYVSILVSRPCHCLFPIIIKHLSLFGKCNSHPSSHSSILRK